MTMQQRTEPSPAAVLISVAVLALVLTVAFGPLGFVIGLALFALMFVGTKRRPAAEQIMSVTRNAWSRSPSMKGRRKLFTNSARRSQNSCLKSWKQSSQTKK